MRIRTLKPEFWSHPVMGRQSGELQSIAIGMLNMADDEGYLLADPLAVRSCLRPFDESSSKVRQSIEELQRLGWVVVRTHQTHLAIGFLPTFKDHQRIDRPKPSKLKKYWEVAIDDSSTIDRRRVDDESTIDRRSIAAGREGNREQGTEQGGEEEPATTTGPVETVENSKPFDGLKFFERVNTYRIEHGKKKQSPSPPQEKLEEFELAVCDEFEHSHADQLWAVYLKWIRDPYWADAKPPFPFSGFMAMWRDHL